MDNAESYLLERGYTKTVSASITAMEKAEALYQKRFDTETGKRFINVFEYDLRPVFHVTSKSYVVEHSFAVNCDDLWFQGKFYNLTAGQVRRLLSNLEEMYAKVFDLVGGLGQ